MVVPETHSVFMEILIIFFNGTGKTTYRRIRIRLFQLKSRTACRLLNFIKISLFEEFHVFMQGMDRFFVFRYNYVEVGYAGRK
jgi:hypothetical protein